MASKFRFTVLVTFVLLLQISFSSQKITSVERHLVAIRGSKVILRCVGSLNTNPVYWIHRRPGEQRVDIVSDGRADSAGDIQHVIERVNFNHGGNYKCQDPNGHDTTELIVVSDNSSCRLEPASREVSEQEVVTFTCRLSYSGNSAPYLRWTDSDNNSKEDAATVRRSEGVNASPEIESRINVTINRFDQVRSYLASVCLPDTGTKCLPFWQSPSLRVFVSVVNVTVAMVTLNTGWMALNCSAVGYPTPSYIWVDPTGRITQGSIVLLSDSLHGSYTYKCIAWNTFRSRNYTVEAKIDIYLPERTSSYSDEPTTAAVTATSTSSEVFVIDGFLVRIFGAGLLILVAIVAFACVCIAAILFSRRRRRQREPVHRSDSDLNEESKRTIVNEVSLEGRVLHISLATQSDRSPAENPTSAVYEEINDDDYKKYSKFIGTTSASKERNQYLPLNCVSSIEDEGEIQMPSEYMTTLAAAELKIVRQTMCSEPIIGGRHYLQVLP